MQLKLKDLKLNFATQTRAAINEGAITSYAERMESGDTFPDVIIYHDGTEHYVADGFHRILAAERLGRKDINAEVHNGTRLDAIKFGLGANKNHGMPMSRKDKENSIRIALREFSDMTDNAIADLIGVSFHTVASHREQLSTLLNSTKPKTRKGKDGKQYPTERKPRKQAQEPLQEPEHTQEPPHIQTADEETSPATPDYNPALSRMAAVKRESESTPETESAVAGFIASQADKKDQLREIERSEHSPVTRMVDSENEPDSETETEATPSEDPTLDGIAQLRDSAMYYAYGFPLYIPEIIKTFTNTLYSIACDHREHKDGIIKALAGLMWRVRDLKA